MESTPIMCQNSLFSPKTFHFKLIINDWQTNLYLWISGWQMCSLKVVFIRDKKYWITYQQLLTLIALVFSFYMYICYFNILGAGDLSDIINSVCHAFALNGQVFFGNTCRIYSGLVRFKKRTINMYWNLHSIHKNNMYNRKVSDEFSNLFFKQ